MAFDPTNPATYDDGFKSFIRQRGLSGREVDVSEVQALYDEFSGTQAQATQQATSLLSSIPDPTPNATAAAADTSFTGPQMDLNDMSVLTGGPQRGPIASVVEQAAQEEAAAAAQPPQPTMEDELRMFAQERVAPVIDNLRQQRARINSTTYKNTYAKKLDLDAVGVKVAQNITALESAGVWGPTESTMYRSLIEDEKAPPEEALARTFNAKLNPPTQNQGNSVANPAAREALENAAGVLATTQKVYEMNPEDPDARRAYSGAWQDYKAIQKEAGLSSEPNLMEDYRETRKKLDTLRNAQTERIPAIIVDGQTVTEDQYDQAILGLQAQLGTFEASPDFRNAVPQIDETSFDDPEKFKAAIQEAGGIYRDKSGRLVTPQRFEEEQKKARFTTFKPKENEPTPEVAPTSQSADIPVGVKNMIRRMIQEGQDLTNTRFSPETISAVREEMNEEQIESALRSLYAGNSWASQIGLRNPMIKDEDLSGVLGRTDDAEAAKFLSEIDPEMVKRVYEKADRLQGFSARGLKSEDGTWSQKVDTPEKVLSRIRALASKRGK